MNITMFLIYINMVFLGRGNYFVRPRTADKGRRGWESPGADKSQALFATRSGASDNPSEAWSEETVMQGRGMPHGDAAVVLRER